MTDSLAQLLVTDAQLDAIAHGLGNPTPDPVLDALADLAGALDHAAIPAMPPLPCPAPVAPAARKASKSGWALVATVALMITSSGVAAAVTDDPLAPLRFVAHQVARLGPQHPVAPHGWDLDGSGPIGATRGGHLVTGSGGIGSVTGAGARGGSATRSAVPRSSTSGSDSSAGLHHGDGAGGTGRGQQPQPPIDHPPGHGEGGRPPRNIGTGTRHGNSTSPRGNDPSRPTAPQGNKPSQGGGSHGGTPGMVHLPAAGVHCRMPINLPPRGILMARGVPMHRSCHPESNSGPVSNAVPVPSPPTGATSVPEEAVDETAGRAGAPASLP